LAEQQPPSPVPGTVIDTSRGTLVFYALCLGVFGFLSGFVLWNSWGQKEGEGLLPFQLAKDSLFSWFLVGLGAFGGLAGCVACLCRAVFPERLILGDDVLQVTRPGAATVDAQVPYSNIATVACEQEYQGTRHLQVGIDLIDPDAAGTYARRRDLRKKVKGMRDLYLPTSLTESPQRIADLLAEKCNKKAGPGGNC